LLPWVSTDTFGSERRFVYVSAAQFLPITPVPLTVDLLKNVVISSLSPSTPVATQRTTVQLVAAIARFSPPIVASALGDLVPGILKGASQDDDELRESSLQVRLHAYTIVLKS
jgi:cullin-associated NEDD8-dissociated protein 1